VSGTGGGSPLDEGGDEKCEGDHRQGEQEHQHKISQKVVFQDQRVLEDSC